MIFLICEKDKLSYEFKLEFSEEERTLIIVLIKRKAGQRKGSEVRIKEEEYRGDRLTVAGECVQIWKGDELLHETAEITEVIAL